MDGEWISKANFGFFLEKPGNKNKSFVALLNYFGELEGFEALLNIIEYKQDNEKENEDEDDTEVVETEITEDKKEVEEDKVV